MTNTETGCSFCGATRDAVQKLIAGPAVFICDQCALKGLTTLKGGKGVFAAVKDASIRCGFCGKTRERVGAIVQHPTLPEMTICSECLELCADIFIEDWTGDRKEKLEREWAEIVKEARVFNKASRPKFWKRLVAALRQPF